MNFSFALPHCIDGDGDSEAAGLGGLVDIVENIIIVGITLNLGVANYEGLKFGGKALDAIRCNAHKAARLLIEVVHILYGRIHIGLFAARRKGCNSHKSHYSKREQQQVVS